MLLTSSDTKQTLGWGTNTVILVYKFRPERTGFNMYRKVYATAINFPCIITLAEGSFKVYEIAVEINVFSK